MLVIATLALLVASASLVEGYQSPRRAQESSFDVYNRNNEVEDYEYEAYPNKDDRNNEVEDYEYEAYPNKDDRNNEVEDYEYEYEAYPNKDDRNNEVEDYEYEAYPNKDDGGRKIAKDFINSYHSSRRAPKDPFNVYNRRNENYDAYPVNRNYYQKWKLAEDLMKSEKKENYLYGYLSKQADEDEDNEDFFSDDVDAKREGCSDSRRRCRSTKCNRQRVKRRCQKTCKQCSEGSGDRGGSSNGGSGKTKKTDLGQIQRDCLTAHNNFRAQHQETPKMEYNSALAAQAQSYAEYLAKNNKFAHSKRKDGEESYGENIYARSYSSPGHFAIAGTATKASQSWYNEINNYSFAQGKSKNGKSTGHFTQIVWDKSVSLGCGVAMSQDTKRIVVVAQYRPPGNYKNVYKEHVHPLK